jgi:hypothetical protein
MEPTPEAIASFVRTTLPACGNAGVIETIAASRAERGWTWDQSARNAVYAWLKDAFGAQFPEAPDNPVYMEGVRRIPLSFKQRTFFGTAIYPDGAVVTPGMAIAIELDHGRKGSTIRNALSKAAFAITLGGFHEAHVLFIVEGQLAEQLADKAADEEVLTSYQRDLKTYLPLIREA